MLKKIVAALVLFAFTHVHASAPVAQAKQNVLENAFTELEYQLTVEWDQEDESFLNHQLMAFEAEVQKLQNSGMSNAELINRSLSRIKNKKTQEELVSLFQVVKANEMAPREARRFVVNAVKQGQVEGTSWSGNRLKTKLFLILAIVIVLIVVITIKITQKDDDCEENCSEDKGDDDDDCIEECEETPPEEECIENCTPPEEECIENCTPPEDTCLENCDFTNLDHGISYVRFTLEDGTTIKIEEYVGDVKDPTDPQQYIDYIEHLTGKKVVGYIIKAGTGIYNPDGSSAGEWNNQYDNSADYETNLNDLYSGGWW